MFADWLTTDYTLTTVAPGDSDLVVYYNFDGGTDRLVPDESGNGYDATVVSPDGWDPNGAVNGCLNVGGEDTVTPGSNFMVDVNSMCTISFWAYGDPPTLPSPDLPHQTTIMHFNRSTDLGRVYLQIGNYNDITREVTACWLEMGYDTAISDHDAIGLGSEDPADWEGQWNHYAFVKNANTGLFRLYINGVIRAEETDNYGIVYGHTIDPLEMTIGGNWNQSDRNWTGKLDEFRVYKTALTQAEVGYLAGLSQVYQPILSNANVSDEEPANSRIINFKDFAALASGWLEEQLWP
jgi:hypothetical protein